MLKKVFGSKLSRNSNSRRALFRSLIVSLILNEKIETTKAKAKAVQGQIDKLFNKASKGDVHNRRLVLSYLANEKTATDKLFGELKELTKVRKSGFTRIVNLPNRKGDNAAVVRLELVKWLQK